jgi:hypothetical protein
MFLTIGFIGCPQKGHNEAIIGVVKSNLMAMEKEDIESVKRTIDTSSPAYAMTIDMTEEIFQQYDLKYTLESVKMIEAEETTARVWFIQVTEKISGPAFRNNRLTGIHTLKKIDGSWVITHTEIEEIDYLDEQ